MKKQIIISVTSDLSTDQRVHRAALALYDEGYDVLLIGRLLKNSLDISNRPYKTRRFKLWFNKGPLFYANYNLRLFFFLMFNRTDILFANDLDTLLPNYLISKLKVKVLVYDNHEYYTGVPELVSRPFIRGIWKSIERWIFPKLKYVYTVNQSIADLYEQEYKVKVSVLRNVPIQFTTDQTFSKNESRIKLNLPLDKFLIIMQGNGINVDRGGEETVEAMQYVDDAFLLIAGNGDVIEVLKKMVVDLKLHDKIIFKSRMPYSELVQYTQCADLGLTLDKSTNINYRLSLPNKLFDYIQCGVPILSSDLVEVKKIVQQYNIGTIVQNIFPLELAKKINEVMEDDNLQRKWKENLKQAAKDLNWENEKIKFLEIFKAIN
ncbi:MAG: glycosyltransferase [Bacteroidia bacterium]